MNWPEAVCGALVGMVFFISIASTNMGRWPWESGCDCDCGECDDYEEEEEEEEWEDPKEVEVDDEGNF